MIKDLINRLYWKLIGEVTIHGRIDGVNFILCTRRGSIQHGRLYLDAGNHAIDRLFVEWRYVSPKEFMKIRELQKH